MRLDTVRVLVVDDNAMNRATLTALLKAMGVGVIDTAADGQEGLAAVEAKRPDLVLLDVMMPQMDGFEMCRRLRKFHPRTELPVLFVTALDEPKQRAACFAAGGTDVVSKPFNVAEITARVGVHLENRQLLAGLKDYRARVRHELAVARAAQFALLPEPARLAGIRNRTGIAIEGVIETSSEMGGDFWTVFEPDRGSSRIGILLADFAGHGVAASLNVFRLHALMSRRPSVMLGPADLLALLNRELKELLAPGQFAAAFVGVVDGDADTLTYAGASMPSPILVVDGETEVLDTAGPPLGAFADATYDEHVTAMPPGAGLMAYSDALLESLVEGVPVVDEATLPAWVVTAMAGISPTAGLLSRFREWIPGEPPDDLTLVSVRR
jgi:sigma-B regulation protein RsbU (phosphoserine phosphatase)